MKSIEDFFRRVRFKFNGVDQSLENVREGRRPTDSKDSRRLSSASHSKEPRRAGNQGSPPIDGKRARPEGLLTMDGRRGGGAAGGKAGLKGISAGGGNCTDVGSFNRLDET
ncbi:hypothetical protein OF83DRAFT_1125297 [Amylostereum chailletii]|nr:hypothetical protein OF83DRAFT_1125297 [Amylostereum chailletii]